MTDFYVQKGHGGTDSGTETNPYLTIDQAMNAITSAGAGPHNIYVKTPVSGDYTELASVDTAGSATGVVSVVGYDVSIDEDPPVQITINGSSTNNYGISSGVTSALYYTFRNIKVINSTGTGLAIGNGDSVSFFNCTSDNNGGSGCTVDNNAAFLMCTFSSNTDDGVNGDNELILFGCKIFANGDDGVFANNSVVMSSLFYGMTGSTDSYVTGSASTTTSVIGCTMDGEGVTGGIGIRQQNAAAPPSLFVNNILYDLGTAVDLAGASGGFSLAGYNLINSNDTDYSNITAIPNSDVTGAPQFTDEAGDDYTLASGSPAIDAGLDASDAP